jgi:hypothetical protein
MRLTGVDGFWKAKWRRSRNRTQVVIVSIRGVRRLFIALAAAGFLSVVRGELHNPQMYSEMCDASAAVALDENHFAVADDEGNTLRVYKKGDPKPTGEYEVHKFLGNARRAESDLEGAARIGNRIYWISSHGRNREGDEAPQRQRFFATDIEGKNGHKLRAVGKAYAGLLEDLIEDQSFKRFGLEHASLRSPKHKGGLNIEGMCAGPNGSLLIAFRTPVPHGKALIAPLLNPEKVINGERAKFGEMITLDLGGFGIRDLTPAGDGFLLIASAVHGPKTFRIYWWDGKDGKPEAISGESFEGLNPEAIFRFPDDPPGVFQILSDDGKLMGAGRPCKDFPKEQRHFRAGELHIELPKR